MHIVSTLGIAAALSVTPALIPPFQNPIQSMSVSAGGVMVETTADGLKASAAKGSDFTFTITLKDGSPIRVRL